jgi:CheY-like chemotaxis protein
MKPQRNFQRPDLEALNYIHEPVWVFDIVRRSMFWANDAAVSLWSADSLEELLDRSFKDMSEATQMRLDAYLERFLQGESIQEQWTFYPKGENTIVVDCTFSGISIEEGRLAMLTTGKLEYGAQKTSTKDMAEKEKETLRATEMMRQLPVSAYLMDLQGNILEQNPESLAVFGSIPKRNDDTPSTFVRRFVDPTVGADLLRQAAEQHGKDVSAEALQHTVHGTQWSSIKIRRTRDPITSKPVLLCTAGDITHVMRDQRQPPTPTQMHVLTNMAHAMRPLLQHIFTIADLLTRQSDEPNDCHQMLLTTTQMLIKVVDNFTDIMDRTKNHHDTTTNNETSPTIKQLDLRQVLARAVKAVQDTIQQQLSVRTVIFSRSVNNGTAALMGDSEKLQSVFHTLLRHASRFGRAITVIIKRLSNDKRSASRKCRIRFEIRLRGSPFAASTVVTALPGSDQVECCHDKDDTSPQQERAEMAQCRETIQDMGGELIVTETRPSHDGLWVCMDVPFVRGTKTISGSNNNGSSFLRRKKRGHDYPSTIPNSTTPLETVLDVEGEGGMNILLVDQDSPSRNVMATLLGDLGHTVTMVDSGDDMIHSVLNGDFDAVLVEAQLQGVGGDGQEVTCSTLEAAAQLRNFGFSAEALPLIALTTLPPPSDYAELGLNGWLTKPVLVRDVQKAITNAICNTGRSVSCGSLDDSTICTAPSLVDKLHDSGNEVSTGRLTRETTSTTTSHDSTPVMPRRGSFYSSTATLDHVTNVQNS